MIYGAARNPVASMVVGKTGSFAGQYTDELVMAGLSWIMSKQSGMIGEVGRKGLIVENANIGATLSSGFIGGTPTGQGGI